MFSDCRCHLITAFVGDDKLILILSYQSGCMNCFVNCAIEEVARWQYIKQF